MISMLLAPCMTRKRRDFGDGDDFNFDPNLIFIF